MASTVSFLLLFFIFHLFGIVLFSVASFLVYFLIFHNVSRMVYICLPVARFHGERV